MSAAGLVLLGAIGLVGGVGITAVGPGGVLPTIGLFALTSLSPAQVAGTSIVTHVATGALGTAAYTRSGQLREPATRRMALVLAATALVGTPLGVLAGTAVSRHAFAVVLGCVVAAAAGLVWYRANHTDGTQPASPPTGATGAMAGAAETEAATPPTPLIVALGLAVSVLSGIVGVGGPMLAVPLLAAAGLPVLRSLACAQAQSIVIATVGTVGYLVHGTIDWPLAVLVGLPELAGVLVGWKIAHALPTRALRNALVVTLGVLALYLVGHG
ncbi:sulfite exporter TauE/SafE family protein [Streptomyces montanisoli]|uniref:Probable membrane transporter protein n=1 Tax=Streptomyces montanisoli TaxID=2798581 RepID=A0A940RUB3_9ACTN|nr:sulfite exporter TauE/SafE family protein [Streptomyces montanisoli]MBP0457015.1 sulfite exporter TauE/SafE family protein [Streptomyces montanisoli]